MTLAALPFTGTVYGTLLNFRGEYDAWAPRMDDAPYKAPPKAPVLYVKTANTFTPNGGTIPVPARVPEVEIGATVGVVMKGPGQIAGFVLLNDLSIPHDSYYRPPVKFKCLDGFLGVGERLRPRNETGEPAIFVLKVSVNGQLVQTVRFADLVRPLDTLLADVGEFMTLGEGDVLMLGCAGDRPRAKAGDRIEISMPALGTLTHTLVAEAA